MSLRSALTEKLLVVTVVIKVVKTFAETLKTPRCLFPGINVLLFKSDKVFRTELLIIFTVFRIKKRYAG